MRRADPYRVAISGYYGCGNSGDEAVLAGIRDAFQQLAGDRVKLTALSQSPDATRTLHNIQAEYRMDFRTLKAVVGSSDLLISGGGSLLQDTTSLKSLLYYLYVMRLAAARRVPFMLYAQGIGPLRRGISRRLVRMTVSRAARITVRDDGSAALLREIGVGKSEIEVTADPAFALNPAACNAVNQVFEREAIPGDAIGVALRPWGDPARAPLERYRDLLKQIELSTQHRCVLIPMHHPDDLDFARRLSSNSAYPIVSGEYSPGVVMGLVTRLSMVVAMRLHTLIFAAAAGVPPVALSYDPKVSQLMKRLDLSHATFDWQDFEPAKVAERIRETLHTRNTSIERLKICTANLESAALRNCEIALELLS